MHGKNPDDGKAPAAPERSGAFFGRRKGKRLRSHQADLIETLLPRLALDLTKPAPADLRTLFAVGVEEVRLEIGFGGGEHFVDQAAHQPAAGFLGVEAFVNGMAKALAAIERERLSNVRLHLGDATDILAWLPAAALTRIDLLYPDPWPKRRHWKRRFVQENSIAAFARILRPGGEFRFATDIPDYAAWTLRRLLACGDFSWDAQAAADWQRPWRDFEPTRYEAKARREGRRPCYLTFRRL
ncbi:MAG: tRNA (guanosine(46)-N7)-methyltransferase TrmB [Pseudorhodoplanes sp.]|nr:tRNA (guanosine(46)-N7)-methyltransferase TrmB [Pseudorhodoplanes sp.]